MIEDLPFTIGALRDAHAAGLAPAAVMRDLDRRLAPIGDPGIFLARFPLGALVAMTEALEAHDPSRPHRAFPSRSRRISTSAACRPRPPAPPSPATRDACVITRRRAAEVVA